MITVLKRVEPEEHIDRWYMVAVQPTLFEPLAVICTWGNRQNSWQQSRILPVASTTEAYEVAEKIITQKVKRGYIPIFVSNSSLLSL